MKATKRVVALLLTVVLVFGLIPVSAFAQETDTAIVASGECGAEGDNVTWELYSNGLLKISGTGAMCDIENQNLIPWGSLKEDILRVEIGNGVTQIGDLAFFGCSSLSSVTIPDSVIEIGYLAFGSCSNLNTVDIPDSVTSIGQSAFAGCSSLSSVIIPSSVVSIGYSAFDACSGLNNVTIQNGVIFISYHAFYRCSSLSSITIPASVTHIGDYAFSECSSLTGIWVDENNQTYSSDTRGVLFDKEKSNLIMAPGGLSDKYIIPDSVNTIGNYSFAYCSGLSGVTIPSSVISIGDSAFRDCSRLSSITIPNSVTSIGDGAFYNCSNLNGVALSDSITSIGEHAFSCCSSLSSVILPDNVTSIGSHAFSYCSSLSSVTISNSVTSIENCVFADCFSLNNIAIPDGVTSIGTHAFGDCSGLSSITIPNSVISIEEGAFFNCSSLKDVHYTGTEEQWNAITMDVANSDLTSAIIHFNSSSIPEVDNNENVVIASGECGAEGDNVTWKLYSNGILKISGTGKMCDMDDLSLMPWYSLRSDVLQVEIENGVTHVGNYAFIGCALKEVKLPDSVSSLGECAFATTNLTQINIPSGVTNIGYMAFASCGNLTGFWVDEDNLSYSNDAVGVLFNKDKTVLIQAPWKLSGDYAIPSSVNSIGEEAFKNCKSMSEVLIPDSVTSIGAFAFDSCVGLRSVTIPDSVTTISRYAFNCCSSLVEINIPIGVMNISEGVFNECSQLSSVVIPDGVTSIDHWAFQCCSGLESIYIPVSVSLIDDVTFYGCSSLTDIYYAGTEEEWNAISINTYNDELNLATIHFNNTSIPKEDSNENIVIASGKCGAEGDNVTWKLYNNGLLKISGTGAMLNIEMFDVVDLNLIPWASNKADIFQVEIDYGVTHIGNYAFWGCHNLTGVAIPDSVTSIGSDAFAGCFRLNSISIPDSVTSIGDSAFHGCSGLNSVTIPDNVTIIGDSAFYGCSRLRSVVIPEGVASIESRVFLMCSSLNTVTIPDSVTSIGKSAFEDCRFLSDIYYAGTEEQWSAITIGYMNDELISSTIHYDYESTHTEHEFEVWEAYTDGWQRRVCYICGEEQVKQIPAGYNGFCGNELLWKYDASTYTLTISGTGAMSDYYMVNPPWANVEIRSIIVEEGVTTIGYYAFDDARACSSVSSVQLPSTLVDIGMRGFGACSTLTSIVIPDSVTAIHSAAFNGCYNLENIKLPVSLQGINSYTFEGCTRLKEVVIPENVTRIDGLAFYGCTGLSGTLVIPQNVTIIGDGAFNGCTGLTEIYFEGDAPDIGDYVYVEGDTVTDWSAFVGVEAACYYPVGNETWTEEVRQNYGGKLEWVAYCKEHHYESVVTAPTCTEQGYTTYTCACGDSYLDNYVTAAGHSYGDWEVTKAPTGTEAGVETRKCSCGAEETKEIPILNNPFEDVVIGKFYYEPVLWAYTSNITTGKDATHFNPSGFCTRSQVVTFLWRAAGEPEPISTNNPFPDVPEGKFYTKAVLWAVEKGITGGYKDGTFGPNDACTRGQIVTFLWRYFGEPAPASLDNPFPDVADSKFYYQAVLWAVEEGVTGGFKDGTFGPGKTCTRDQIVTFLYRSMVE